MKRVPNMQCQVCHKETKDNYMVTDECWRKAGFDFFDNVHLECLAQRLGRQLERADFVDAPINADLLQERFG